MEASNSVKSTTADGSTSRRSRHHVITTWREAEGGVLPKHVTVWCANSGSGDPTSPSIAGPFFVKSSATDDRGAYVAKVTTTSLRVRAGSYLGINEAHNGWLTSGRYRVVVWA